MTSSKIIEDEIVCCPCSGPTTTISAMFTDAPDSLDITEITSQFQDNLATETTEVNEAGNDQTGFWQETEHSL